MMIPNLNFLIYYACVAKGGATILAEFNSKDADLGALAVKVKCLEKTPSFHSIFSHAVRSKTYIFLLDHFFSYFAILDENLDNSEGLSFLKSVKDAFNQTVENNSVKKLLGTLNSHCFQGEFNPVFLQLLASNSEFETPNSPRMVLKLNHGRSGSLDSLGGKKIGSADDGGSGSGSGSGSSSTRGLSREISVVMHKNVLLSGELGKEEAKRVRKKQVWVVLCLDLIVCCLLFAIGLWVCRGFKCIDG